MVSFNLIKKKINFSKFIKKIKFNPVEEIIKILKYKELKRQEFLKKEYDLGRVLKVDDDTDNKKYFLELEKKE